jgi:SAM-dependent methyltransferase
LNNQEENTWGEFPRYHQDEGFQKLWRTHSDSVNIALLIRWQPVNQTGSLLKTDLFDGAVSDGLSSWLNSQAKKVFYIDTSLEVHQMAQCHHSHLQTIRTDVRCLPFSQGSFDGIISNSTLNHFKSLDEILTSLRELYRMLRPGGQMILTLDHLANPILLYGIGYLSVCSNI